MMVVARQLLYIPTACFQPMTEIRVCCRRVTVYAPQLFFPCYAILCHPKWWALPFTHRPERHHTTGPVGGPPRPPAHSYSPGRPPLCSSLAGLRAGGLFHHSLPGNFATRPKKWLGNSLRLYGLKQPSPETSNLVSRRSRAQRRETILKKAILFW